MIALFAPQSSVHRRSGSGPANGGIGRSFADDLELRVSASAIPGGAWNVDDAESFLYRGQQPLDIDVSNWREVWNEDLAAKLGR